MIEKRYMFAETESWMNLVSTCVPLDDHESNPPVRILGLLVSFLNEPASLPNGTLIRSLNEYVPDGEHKDKIINAAVILYVNLLNELTATERNHAKSYFLIDASRYVLIGMMYYS